MTESPDRADRLPDARPWYTRPKIVLPVTSVLVVLAALFAREPVGGRAGDPRLTTFSSQPQGAQMFYELAQHLGWKVERRVEKAPPPSRSVIHALLAPVAPLRMNEVHDILDRVREGAALLVVLQPTEDPISDSLGIRVDEKDFYSRKVKSASSELSCAVSTGRFAPLWPDDHAHLYALGWTRPAPPSVESFITLEEDSVPEVPDPRLAMVGFPYGRGRVVVASDPDILRNDALRVCYYGLDVGAVRALEYLRDGGDAPRTTIVFDEYHQGFGSQPGTASTVAAYLGGTRSGRLFLQLLAAGLVLLLAFAPRTVPPRDAKIIERRSPFEHVDALARAYGQAGATRTTMTRLLHGVRRRTDRATGDRANDDRFLSRVAEETPTLAPDVAAVRHALGSQLSPKELEEAGAALRRIELSLTRV